MWFEQRWLSVVARRSRLHDLHGFEISMPRSSLAPVRVQEPVIAIRERGPPSVWSTVVVRDQVAMVADASLTSDWSSELSGTSGKLIFFSSSLSVTLLQS